MERSGSTAWSQESGVERASTAGGSQEGAQHFAAAPDRVRLPLVGDVPGGYLRSVLTQTPEERFGAVRSTSCFSCASTRTAVLGTTAGYFVYVAARHSKGTAHTVLLLTFATGFGAVAAMSAREAFTAFHAAKSGP